MFEGDSALLQTEDMVNELVGKVIELDEQKKLSVIYYEDKHHFIIGSVVILSLHDFTKGIFSYKAKITDITLSKIFLQDVVLIEATQRRSEIRVMLNMPIIVDAFYDELNEIKTDTSLELTIVDISANGVQLKSHLDVPINFIFAFGLNVIDKKINFRARIVRKTKKGNDFYYGCSIYLANNDQAKLRKYVYENQIKQRWRKLF